MADCPTGETRRISIGFILVRIRSDAKNLDWLPAIASIGRVEMVMADFCMKCDHPNRTLEVDLSDCSYVEVSTLIYLSQFWAAREWPGFETLLRLPKVKKVRDFKSHRTKKGFYRGQQIERFRVRKELSRAARLPRGARVVAKYSLKTYSYLNAIIGSILAARLAGTQQLTTAMVTNNTIADTNVIASTGRTP